MRDLIKLGKPPGSSYYKLKDGIYQSGNEGQVGMKYIIFSIDKPIDGELNCVLVIEDGTYNYEDIDISLLEKVDKVHIHTFK